MLIFPFYLNPVFSSTAIHTESEKCFEYAKNRNPESTPHKHSIDIQLVRIGNVDTKSGAFDADFWIWITPLDNDVLSFQNMILSSEKKPLPPSSWLDFPNAGNIKFSSVKFTESRNEILFRVTGTFYSQFDLKNFPFEVLKMNIYAESVDRNIFDFVFVEGENSIIETAIMSDIYVDNPLATITVHNYDDYDSEYAQSELISLSDTFCRFTATYVEENNSAVIKYLLPLFLITALGLMPLWMGKEYATRVVLSTFLFGGLIVFVNSILSQLPEVSYLTIFDKIYMTVYALFTLSISSSVIQQRISSSDENSPKIQKIRNFSRLLIPIIVLIGIISIVIFKDL
ncbi:hypothetical protein [Nitrosopumilus cobalaminigenes]|nr:hypothetical protein [Nitrosopumilus cobalaminigenes]